MKVVIIVKTETLISYNYAYFSVLRYTNQNKLKRLFKTLILISHIKVGYF